MTLSRRAVLGAPVALLLALGAYYLLRPSDESRIRAKLDALAAAVKINEADMQVNPLGRMAHVSDAFEPLFDPDVRVSVPDLPSLGTGRRALIAAASAASSYVRTLDVDFRDVTVKLNEAATSAAVQATANVRVTERDGPVRSGKRAVDFHFVKPGVGDDWRITTATVWPAEDTGDVAR